VLLELEPTNTKRTREGRAPAHVTVATSEQFARANPDVVRDYLKAYEATVVYIRAHPEVRGEYAKRHQRRGRRGNKTVAGKKCCPTSFDSWDDNQIAVQERLP
jgi:hypothetical protein